MMEVRAEPMLAWLIPEFSSSCTCNMLDEVQLGYVSQNKAQHQMDGLYQFKMHTNTNTTLRKNAQVSG